MLQAFACDVPVQVLLRAAAVFDIDENRTRVALHRLRSAGLADSHERGTYRAFGVGEPGLDGSVGWRRVLERLVPWEGRWVGVHTAHLPRGDKTVARRRDRATRLVGLRELSPGLLVRPDNLVGGVATLRDRLVRLGLEADSPIFRIDELRPEDEARARSLWADLELDRTYRTQTEALTRATLELGRLPAPVGARVAFQLGGRAVHDIAVDPLLPEGLVDPGLREAFVETMLAFDDVGRDVWSRLLDTDLVLRSSPTSSA
jgi:phenylacetic acid degradation operon negative regulatory protein